MPESSGHPGGETLVEQSPVEGPDESGGSGAERRWSAWLPWAIGGAVAVILAIVLTVILIGGHNEPARGRRPAATGSALPALPPGAAFSFANAKVQPVGVRKRVHVPNLSPAAKQIQDSLSVLYDEG